VRAPLELLGRSLRPDSLHLVLLPTEACNFRCSYCYEDFALARMKPWVARGVKNLIAARAPELALLHLAWFGGEPLLARDLVIELMQHARELARAHPRMQVVSDMTTNGWHLERPLFEQLLGLGVRRYQISFDGPRELHDRKRRLAGGGGTFERIWSNLLAMRAVEGEFEINLRIHVDRENAEALPAFLEQCREHFGSDRRFRPRLKALSRLGGPNDSEIDVFLGDEREQVLARLQRLAQGGGPAPAEPVAEHPSCYASSGNSYIVRADGRLSKCTVALTHPRNDVGHIHEDGRLEIESPAMKAWMRGLWSGDVGELICPMLGLADPVRDAAAGADDSSGKQRYRSRERALP
jgi:uncharacterized protein